MNSASLPQPDDDFSLLDAEEREQAAMLSEAWVERIHIGVTALLAFVSLLISFIWMGGPGPGLALVLAFFCLVGLILSRAIRLVLGDFYRQFQYREKFALFMVHVVVLALVRYSLGVNAWGILLGILLVLFCFQALDRIWYGRIYACSVLIVIMACSGGGMEGNLPSGGMIAVWFALLLFSIRFGFVRFRIEKEGTHRGVDLTSVLLRSVPPALGPAVIGWVVYAVSSPYLRPRAWQVMAHPRHADAQKINLPMKTLVWDAVIIIAMIIACLVALNWLDKKLRRRKKGAAPVEEGLSSTEQHFAVGRAAKEEDLVEVASGARARILAALRRYSERLAAAGLARKPAETVEDFFARVSCGAESALSVDGSGTFNAACYSEETVTDADADWFEELLEREGAAIMEERDEPERGA